MPGLALPMYRPWKRSAEKAVKFASELMPWSCANILFKAFISSETYDDHRSINHTFTLQTVGRTPGSL